MHTTKIRDIINKLDTITEGLERTVDVILQNSGYMKSQDWYWAKGVLYVHEKNSEDVYQILRRAEDITKVPPISIIEYDPEAVDPRSEDDIAIDTEFDAASKRIARDAVDDEKTLTPFQYSNKEPKQLDDPENEMMVYKDGQGVIVINKNEWAKYEANGWTLAESFTQERYNEMLQEAPNWIDSKTEIDSFRDMPGQKKPGGELPPIPSTLVPAPGTYRCSDTIRPGMVGLTNPPTYHCEPDGSITPPPPKRDRWPDPFPGSKDKWPGSKDDEPEQPEPMPLPDQGWDDKPMPFPNDGRPVDKRPKEDGYFRNLLKQLQRGKDLAKNPSRIQLSNSVEFTNDNNIDELHEAQLIFNALNEKEIDLDNQPNITGLPKDSFDKDLEIAQWARDREIERKRKEAEDQATRREITQDEIDNAPNININDESLSIAQWTRAREIKRRWVEQQKDKLRNPDNPKPEKSEPPIYTNIGGNIGDPYPPNLKPGTYIRSDGTTVTIVTNQNESKENLARVKELAGLPQSAECGHPLTEGCGWEQAPADPKVRPAGWKPSMGSPFVEDPNTGEHIQLIYRCGPAPQNTSSMLAPGKRGFDYNDKYQFSGDTDITNLSWKEQGKQADKFMSDPEAVKRDPTIKIDPEGYDAYKKNKKK